MNDDVQIDARGLQAPEPMERVLDALSRLLPRQRVVLLIEREPRPLFRILLNNGYRYSVEQDTDGSAGLYRVVIWREGG